MILARGDEARIGDNGARIYSSPSAGTVPTNGGCHFALWETSGYSCRFEGWGHLAQIFMSIEG